VNLLADMESACYAARAPGTWVCFNGYHSTTSAITSLVGNHSKSRLFSNYFGYRGGLWRGLEQLRSLRMGDNMDPAAVGKLELYHTFTNAGL